MNCERASLIALLREAEGDLRTARLSPRRTTALVSAARRVKDLEREVEDWDRGYSARLLRGDGRDCV
jgi:hypothetical protein